MSYVFITQHYLRLLAPCCNPTNHFKQMPYRDEYNLQVLKSPGYQLHLSIVQLMLLPIWKKNIIQNASFINTTIHFEFLVILSSLLSQKPNFKAVIWVPLPLHLRIQARRDQLGGVSDRNLAIKFLFVVHP